MSKATDPSETIVPESEAAAFELPPIETAVKILGVGVGFLYGSGLLMVNFYLLQFGATDFSVLRTRYAFSGVYVLITFALFSASGFYAASSELGGREPFWVRALLATAPIFAYRMLVLVAPLPGDHSMAGAKPYLWIFPVSLLSFCASSCVEYWRVKSRSDRSYGPVLGSFTLLLVGFLMAIAFTAYEVYPRIPAQFGGGLSVRARIAIANDSQSQLTSLGLSFPPASTASFPLDIIHDGESYVVVRTNRGLIQVDRKSVVGISVASFDTFSHDSHIPITFPVSDVKENERLQHRFLVLTAELNTWEFKDLLRWADCRLDSEKDPQKNRVLNAEIFQRIEDKLHLNSDSQCRKECEELTDEFYSACKPGLPSSSAPH
jgi:hypothetical protein